MRHEADALDGASDWDPEFLASRREAVQILLFFVVALCWILPTAAIGGYGVTFDPSKRIATWCGIPVWVVVSIVMPWIVANVATIIFCWRRIRGKGGQHAGRTDGAPGEPRHGKARPS